MQTIVTVVAEAINVIKGTYACVCGHRSRNMKTLTAHYKKRHSNVIGTIDYETGKVAF